MGSWHKSVLDFSFENWSGWSCFNVGTEINYGNRIRAFLLNFIVVFLFSKTESECMTQEA